MTKTDIIEEIQATTGFTRKKSTEVLEAVFSTIKNALESGDYLRITGFGKFVVNQKADRPGRNPQTGETITLSSRKQLTFKPSGQLKKAINGKNNATGNNEGQKR